MGRKKLEMSSGMVFGMLTTIKEIPPEPMASHTTHRWLCRCACGNTTIVPATDLRRGHSTTCGCRGFTEERSASLLDMYRRYQRGAEQRGYEFSLSLDEFIALIKGKCRYCGIEPYNDHKKAFRYKLIYNGIDRIDNTKGYVLSNCAPCCKVCNKMKGTLSEIDFIDHAHRIAEYTKE